MVVKLQFIKTEKIMENRLLLFIILLVSFLLVGVAVNAGTGFTPVMIRTKKLTMTGVRQAPPAEEPRDYQFTPVKIITKPLTMTGMRN